MTTIENILKRLLRIILYSLIYILFLTFLHHFNIISQTVCDYLRFIGFILILFFNSNNMSRKMSKNYALNGLFLGLSLLFIFLISNLLLGGGFTTRTILYYLLLLGVSVLSSCRGKSKKSH